MASISKHDGSAVLDWMSCAREEIAIKCPCIEAVVQHLSYALRPLIPTGVKHFDALHLLPGCQCQSSRWATGNSHGAAYTSQSGSHGSCCPGGGTARLSSAGFCMYCACCHQQQNSDCGCLMTSYLRPMSSHSSSGFEGSLVFRSQLSHRCKQ